MNIAILLSTYNGALYLKDQIDSILLQTYTNWCLYIRDDGSKDNSVDIIDFYTRKYPDRIFKIQDDYGNLKSAVSFMKMLEVVDSDYYMFCDQDDIWLPFKIEKSLTRMKDIEIVNPNKSVLVFTDLSVVDSNLGIINSSMWAYSNINPDNAKNLYKTTCLSSVTGCTLMINKLLKQKVLPYPASARMHDWWISLNAVYYGIVDYITEPTIFYRQHDSNVLGADKLEKNHYLRRLIFLKKTISENIEVFKMLSALNFRINYVKVLIAKIKIILINIKNK